MIFSKHSGYSFDGRRLCHKGGDGGASAMRKMEEERQKRIDDAIKEINTIFDPQPYTRGVNAATEFDPDKTYYNADGTRFDYSQGLQDRIMNPASRKNVYYQKGDYANAQRYSPGTQQNNTVSDVFYRLKYGSALDALNKGQLYTGVETIKPENQREKLYEDQRKAVYDLNVRDVNRQYGDAERNNRFGLARHGLMGGSSDVDSNARLQEMTNEGLMKASGIADDAASNLRTSDEKAKQSLISMAQSGVDTGTAQQMAMESLNSTAQQAQGARSGATVGDLFGNLTQAYLRYNNIDGYGNTLSSNNRGGSSVRSGGDQGYVKR